MWREYRAEDLATPEAFERDPELVWEWYDWRRSVIAGAEPNAGHRALADLAIIRPVHRTFDGPRDDFLPGVLDGCVIDHLMQQ